MTAFNTGSNLHKIKSHSSCCSTSRVLYSFASAQNKTLKNLVFRHFHSGSLHNNDFNASFCHLQGHSDALQTDQ